MVLKAFLIVVHDKQRIVNQSITIFQILESNVHICDISEKLDRSARAYGVRIVSNT